MDQEITTVIGLLIVLLCIAVVLFAFLSSNSSKLKKIIASTDDHANNIKELKQELNNIHKKQLTQLLSIKDELSSAKQQISTLEKALHDGYLKIYNSQERVYGGLLDNKTAMRVVVQETVSQINTVLQAAEANLLQRIFTGEQTSNSLMSELNEVVIKNITLQSRAAVSQIKDTDAAINKNLDYAIKHLDSITGAAKAIDVKVSKQDDLNSVFLGKLEKQINLLENNNKQFGASVGKIDAETYALVKTFSTKALEVEEMIKSVYKDHHIMLELLKLGLMNDVLKDLERAAELNPAG